MECLKSKPGRKRLAPSEKYDVFVQILTQQAIQREAGRAVGVNRSTIISICRTAKQGALDALASARPGKTIEQAQLEYAGEEIDRA